MKKVVIYYFSGCGNSKWVAHKTAEHFQDKNTEAIVINVEGNYISQNADLVGFVFPVYSFGLPKFVIDFLKTYPSRQNQRVFVLTCCNLHEGIALKQAEYLLSKKKCDMVYGRSIYMPDSWTMFFNAPKNDAFEMALTKADKDITYAVGEMMQGLRKIAMASPMMMPVLGLIYVVFYYFGRHFAGKSFVLNNKCNSCRICYEVCPTKTIQWQKNNKPYWSWGCQQCFRCVNKCPKSAIEVSVLPIVVACITFFFGWKFYGLLPDAIENMLKPFWIFPKILFWFLLNFGVMWLLHDLGMKGLLFDFFFTKKRKRYGNMFAHQIEQRQRDFNEDGADQSKNDSNDFDLNSIAEDT